MSDFQQLDLIIVESGGDNLAATFSPELSDLTLYVIDVSAGDKIPRKGGPGITRSDLLIINKIDLAPHVGASLEVMERDARKMRGERPFVFTNLKTGQGLDTVIEFILRQGCWRRPARLSGVRSKPGWEARLAGAAGARFAARMAHAARRRASTTVRLRVQRAFYPEPPAGGATSLCHVHLCIRRAASSAAMSLSSRSK